MAVHALLYLSVQLTAVGSKELTKHTIELHNVNKRTITPLDMGIRIHMPLAGISWYYYICGDISLVLRSSTHTPEPDLDHSDLLFLDL